MNTLGLGALTQRINEKLSVKISYGDVLAAVHTSTIPARLEGKRWVVKEDDVPTVTAYFRRQYSPSSAA